MPNHSDSIRQCIYAVFGGTVDKTGQILHGKTSPLTHDNKGLYQNLPQDLPVTRYHSLAATHPTLPDCLEVSSWISSGQDANKGIIMGVRHKKYTIESVQFHPESILTAQGRLMIKNFLAIKGGTWVDNQHTSSPHVPKYNLSILDKIFTHRRQAVDAQKLVPGQTPADLQTLYDLDLAPPLISFYDRLKQSPFDLALMAEIKRASPSKGPIALSTCAPAQAFDYAMAGASTISVLTEPEWFKGSIDDLRLVRRRLDGLHNRPAILRKEFIFDQYQILEARLAGADTVLLIVKMLDLDTLTSLYKYSISLGMEPLVEVNTEKEMEVAIAIGARIIGVNNRDLVSFKVDLDTTSRLTSMVAKDTILCALSGITGPHDVVAYRKNGVGAVLVGEALMRANDTAIFVRDLLGEPKNQNTPSMARPLVKICGTRSAEAARAAIHAGADLIGIILVTGRKRCVSTETAKSIAAVVAQTERPTAAYNSAPSSSCAVGFFESAKHKVTHPTRARLVGVFQNQPLDYILSQQKAIGLDIVQLHGNEPIDWASLIPVPVIRAFHPGDAGIATTGYHTLPLLDSGAGGTGQQLDLSLVKFTLDRHPGLFTMLAGGLHPENVSQVMTALDEHLRKVAILDVSSGVETDGEQDFEKIKTFVHAVRSKVLN